MRCSRFWLCLPPVLLLLLDGMLTLQGQPTRYWAGDFSFHRELNPIFDVLLAWHPAAFLLGCVAWGVLIILVILFSPRPIALLAAWGCSLGHVCGATSWVVQTGMGGWVVALGMLLVASQAFGWAVQRSEGVRPT